jgi:hemerythrin-like domain-containing protein
MHAVLSTPATAVAPAVAATALPARRTNLYVVVHKGLRLCMADTLAALGRMDPHDEDEVVATLARIRSLLGLCRSHLKLEDCHLHAAMQARRPGSAAHTAADHVEHAAALERLEARIEAVEAANDADRDEVALDLYRELALFVAENLEHMHVEETHNMEVLWACYADEELQGLHDAIVRSIAPADLLSYARWMVPAATPTERAALLSGMQQGAPREAFAALIGIVRPTLSSREWAKVEHAIGPAPFVDARQGGDDLARR